MKLLSIVMPVYNEERWIEEIVRRVMNEEIPLERELVIVDDCSRDRTREKLAEVVKQYPGGSVRVFHHEVNQGKGAALRTGFREARGDVLLIQDADLEYSPSDYKRLLGPVLEGRADVVYGSRFSGEVHRVLFFWHSLGNHFLTLLSNMFTNLNLTDMEVCYKVFRKEVLEGIRIRSNRFGFEPEITAKVARRNVRIYEVPISYDGRDYSEGKKIGWKDGLKAIWCIFFFRFFD
ncbi:MAG TPA: glycosyltransferase family 2 protein [Planctomycetota bacterium]|nr:glycosyltransferase family 2 protein [Planctomycetota bacterium]